MMHTHMETNPLGACIVIGAPTHPRTHTHTYTHIDIGIGTMGLPSLQAMGVGGGLSLLRTFVMGGGLESCRGRGGGAVRGVGGCSFLSFTGGLFDALKIR